MPKGVKGSGTKAQLDSAHAEIAKLKAALSNRQAAEKVAQEFVADTPGSGVTTIGLGGDQPEVTGGMTRKQMEEKAFGKQWWVKVVENDLPFAKDVHRVASYCRGGQYIKDFRANTEVLLPESEINKLENECIVVDTRQVDISNGGMELAAAKALNSGMELKQDELGNYWLVRSKPRFSVIRLRPEQESLTIS